PDWLGAHLDEVRVVDVGWSIENGPHRDRFLSRRLPGAVFADLDADLSDPPGERGRHPLPSPEHFAAVRTRLGMGTRPVVAYDDRGGPVAARLWWMLDAIGHPAAVLDGGLAAWDGPTEAGDGEAESDPDGEPGNRSVAEPAPLAPVPWPEDRFVVVDDVLDVIAGGAVLLDARSADRFAGRPNPVDARPGHIPGSRSRPWTDNVGSDGRLLDPARLREELSALGVGSAELVASCGSGVTGCHDLLAARVAGFDGGRLYTGSWSEWSRDLDRPVATDEGA
ncbi:MAG: sulfurtransferase, partial [Actinomycetota bacterium]